MATSNPGNYKLPEYSSIYFPNSDDNLVSRLLSVLTKMQVVVYLLQGTISIIITLPLFRVQLCLKQLKNRIYMYLTNMFSFCSLMLYYFRSMSKSHLHMIEMLKDQLVLVGQLILFDRDSTSTYCKSTSTVYGKFVSHSWQGR